MPGSYYKRGKMNRFREFQKLLNTARIHNGNSVKKVNDLKKEVLISAFKKLDTLSQMRVLHESQKLREKITWLGEAGALELLATIGLHETVGAEPSGVIIHKASNEEE